MITNETITINNNVLSATEINRLIAGGKEVEAIAYIARHSGLGLKEAKQLVDTLTRVDDMLHEGRESQHQQAKVTKTNKVITVKYTGHNGIEMTVTPSDAAWAEVKKLMPDNDLIKEYEDTWEHNPNETPMDTAWSPSGAAQQNNNLKKYAVIALLALLIFVYFLLK